MTYFAHTSFHTFFRFSELGNTPKHGELQTTGWTAEGNNEGREVGDEVARTLPVPNARRPTKAGTLVLSASRGLCEAVFPL